MTPPNSGNPNLNTMIKEEGNADTGSDPGNNFGQSNNGNNGSGSGPGQMGPQTPQQQGQNTNSNSKQCNNAEVGLDRFLFGHFRDFMNIYFDSTCNSKVRFLFSPRCWRIKGPMQSYTDNFHR